MSGSRLERESGHDFIVRAAGPAADSVRVDYQGRSLNLTMRTAKVASAGQAGNGPPNVAQEGARFVPNPTPGDEQKRLDAVAQSRSRRPQSLEQGEGARQQVGGAGRRGGEPARPAEPLAAPTEISCTCRPSG